MHYRDILFYGAWVLSILQGFFSRFYTGKMFFTCRGTTACHWGTFVLYLPL